MGETASDEVVSQSKRGSSIVLSTNPNCHVCRHCDRVFSSGKALGGHIRVHGSANGFTKTQSFTCRNLSTSDQVADYSSTDVWVKKPSIPTIRSSENYKWVTAHNEEGGHCKIVRNKSKKEEMGSQKVLPLYKLRRSPKPSRRFTDEEFSIEMNDKNISSGRICGECGKEFPSSKALFGHMRCHPYLQRNCMGMQPPNDHYDVVNHNNNANDGGAIFDVPSSVVSSVWWQSSQGSENPQEKAATSHDESDGESLKRWRTEASSSLFTRPATGKRTNRRPIRFNKFLAYQEEDVGLKKMDNGKQLENDRDTANLLVMLSSTASNTNANITAYSANGLVERQLTEESVYHSKKGKPQYQTNGKDWEEKDKEKMNKKRNVDQIIRDENFSKEELVGTGKYKCSTCKKLFNSHQALGGHRASHRQVKGCFAITTVGNDEMAEEEISQAANNLVRLDNNAGMAEDDMMYSSPTEDDERIVDLKLVTSPEQHKSPQAATLSIKKKNKNKDKGHGCRICQKVFPSGQALGGHKRCHWTANTVSLNSLVSTEKQLNLLLLGQDKKVRMEPPPSSSTAPAQLPLLDLNKPASLEEQDVDNLGAVDDMIDDTDVIPAFRNVACNQCGSLCTSVETWKTHQIVHGLMPSF